MKAQQMRIAIIPTPELRCETGSTIHAVLLADLLAAVGHDVHVYCLNHPDLSHSKVTFHGLPLPLVHPVLSLGYPLKPIYGDPITIGLYNDRDVTIFHAGTSRSPDGTLVTSGGRVISIVAVGRDVEETRTKAYNVITSKIHFDGIHYRQTLVAEQCAVAPFESNVHPITDTN